MSKYTTQLRYIVENEKQFPPSEGQLSLKSVLESYPLYKEDYTDVITGQVRNRRTELNNKIINHYYFREIGFETVNMFLFKLSSKMNNIMNYYNQMYKSSDIEFNPLWNVEMHETYTHTISGTGTTTTSGTNTNTGNTTSSIDGTGSNEYINVDSDTPQSGITETDIKANLYASKTSHGENTSVSSSDTTNTVNLTDTTEGEINSTDNKTETFSKLTEGSSAGLPYSDAIKQWRHIMVNIDLMVVDELNDLFMNVW